MDAYSMVRGGKLSLKHKKGHSKASSSKKKAAVSAPEASAAELDEKRHGGWWAVERLADVSGNIALELEDMRYLRSLDNGGFELGQSHSPGESPDPEEMLLAVKTAGTGKLSFKTGFGKFVGVTASKGELIATADAIGQLEMWDVTFEDDNAKLTCGSKGVLTVLPDGILACRSEKEFHGQKLKIRSCVTRKIDPNASLPVEERGDVKQTEINYVKSFQLSWVAEKRLKMSGSDKTSLETARKEGTFHEALLDRREKIKSDKFCK